VGRGVNGRTLLCAPWRGDGHRDHRVAGEVAAAVGLATHIPLVEYPVWLWHWGDPTSDDLPWDEMFRLDLGPSEALAKKRALAAHRSQVEPLSPAPGDEAVLHPDMLRHFERDFEVLIQVAQPTSLPVEFFDDFYEGRSDPWGFETRWYEERKRALTLASLPRPRFVSALEVGCSTGVLTTELATRCDRVTGVDIAAAPLAVARHRVPGHVTLAQLATPSEWPDGEFDLVVLSEVGYYYGPRDLALLLDKVLACLTPDGVLLACHWRHQVLEYPLGGDDVHAALAARGDLARLMRHVEEDFLLDVFTRPPGVSVAANTGLIGGHT
jgi:SAM-dependent methyltransferase